MPDTIPPIIWLRAVLGFTAVPIAHRYRLEVNFESLPVNRPKCLIHTYNRDGFMRFDENGGEGPNYEPNSFDGLVEDPAIIMCSASSTSTRIPKIEIWAGWHNKFKKSSIK